MNVLRQITYYILMTVLLSVVVMLLIITLPLGGAYDIRIVNSGSMEPTIPIGSIVLIHPTGDYTKDDVITYQRSVDSGIPTTHRIIDTEKTGGGNVYTTKGDANESQDMENVRESEIIGEVLFSVPYLGYILNFAKKPAGWATFIGIPGLIIIIDGIRKKYKSKSAGESAQKNS